MYQIDQTLHAAAVGLLAWAESLGKPFSEADINERFVNIDEDRHPLLFYIPHLVQSGYLSQEEVDFEQRWQYMPPVSDDIPAIFKAFVKKYHQALQPGTSKSAPACWKRLKLHKDYKKVLPSLDDALDRLVAFRAAKKAANAWLAYPQNLDTWINQRGWEAALELPAVTVQEDPADVSAFAQFCRERTPGVDHSRIALGATAAIDYLVGRKQWQTVSTVASYEKRARILAKVVNALHSGVQAVPSELLNSEHKKAIA